MFAVLGIGVAGVGLVAGTAGVLGAVPPALLSGAAGLGHLLGARAPVQGVAHTAALGGELAAAGRGTTFVEHHAVGVVRPAGVIFGCLEVALAGDRILAAGVFLVLGGDTAGVLALGAVPAAVLVGGAVQAHAEAVGRGAAEVQHLPPAAALHRQLAALLQPGAAAVAHRRGRAVLGAAVGHVALARHGLARGSCGAAGAALVAALGAVPAAFLVDRLLAAVLGHHRLVVAAPQHEAVAAAPHGQQAAGRRVFDVRGGAATVVGRTGLWRDAALGIPGAGQRELGVGASAAATAGVVAPLAAPAAARGAAAALVQNVVLAEDQRRIQAAAVLVTHETWHRLAVLDELGAAVPVDGHRPGSVVAFLVHGRTGAHQQCCEAQCG